jgi:hypothetical protein
MSVRRPMNLKRRQPDGRVVSGKITDPALAIPGSVYTSALDRGLPLKVTAKPTLKDGEIHTLYVSDAKLLSESASI